MLPYYQGDCKITKHILHWPMVSIFNLKIGIELGTTDCTLHLCATSKITQISPLGWSPFYIGMAGHRGSISQLTTKAHTRSSITIEWRENCPSRVEEKPAWKLLHMVISFWSRRKTSTRITIHATKTNEEEYSKDPLISHFKGTVSPDGLGFCWHAPKKFKIQATLM